ncbi:MFS transporter [Paenibacillus residui]|uniref:MFS transporter n=1 Tax=Paenibacillus residui TaxID=629724 RepID=A0ABW3D7G4_9BACL
MSSPREALRSRYVRAVMVSGLFSQIGIWIRNLSVLLFVMEQTGGNALAVSMISVAEYAPIFIFSFLGGVFADRWRPRRTVIWCDLLSALSVFAVLASFELGAWPAVFFTTLCSSILSQFAQPSGMKLFKIHVPEDQAQASMSLLQTMISVFMIVGPMLGTVVYQNLGMAAAIAMTGFSFLLSAAAMAFIPPDPEAGSAAKGKTSLWKEMSDGIRYVLSRPVLRLLSISFVAVGLGVGLISPLGIFVVTERLGLSPEYLQWLLIPYGLGEMAGGFLAFGAAGRIPPQRLLVLGLVMNAAGIALMGVSGVLWLAMLAQLIIALFQPAIFIGNHSLVIQNTDVSFIGRVTGIRTPLMTGSMVIMMSLSGVLKEMFPLIVLYSAAALLFIIGTLVVLPLPGTKSETLGADKN